MNDPVVAFDSHTVHQHEWIVLSAHPEKHYGKRDGVSYEGTTGNWRVTLLCPHCERTKTFPTKPLYE